MLIATSRTVHAGFEEQDAPVQILEGDVAALAKGEVYRVVALKSGDLFVCTETGSQTVATGIEAGYRVFDYC